VYGADVDILDGNEELWIVKEERATSNHLCEPQGKKRNRIMWFLSTFRSRPGPDLVGNQGGQEAVRAFVSKKVKDLIVEQKRGVYEGHLAHQKKEERGGK